MSLYLSIAVGGALGALSRYWLTTAVETLSPGRLPLGTFTVNVLGSFLIGVIFVLIAEKAVVGEQWRPLLTVGFLGSMTTFSTFSLEALTLLQQGYYSTAFTYLLSSILVCLAAAFGGMMLARWLF